MIQFFLATGYEIIDFIVKFILLLFTWGLSYRMLDRLTPYDTGKELRNNNIAVAILHVGLCVVVVWGLIKILGL